MGYKYLIAVASEKDATLALPTPLPTTSRPTEAVRGRRNGPGNGGGRRESGQKPVRMPPPPQPYSCPGQFEVQDCIATSETLLTLSVPPVDANARRVFIKSFGCQMNVYDSQRMADVAGQEGYAETDRVEDADLVVLNTCHIRERASEKIYSELGKIRELKQARAAEGRATTLVVAGCVAQAEGGEILRRQPAVDLVVGPQNYHRLPDLIARSRRERIVDTEFPLEHKFDLLPAPSREIVRARGVSAFVTVQEGCNKFCSFCVVPYTRGAENSRPVVKVLDEIARLADNGAREFTLLGQNVNAYHGLDAAGRATDLAGLLEQAARIPGVLRLRYATSHPLDMNEALIRAHADNEKLAPYLHLPIQSGSDRILDAMNRRHTAREYLAIVERVRAINRDIAFSSDFIVGFPGETEAEFRATFDLAAEVGFASAYAFKYSARPGTPAAEARDAVAEEVKVERHGRLFERLEALRMTFNRSVVGRKFRVVFDKPGRHEGQLIGRSPYMQAVNADVPASRIGELVDVEIVEIKPNSLRGQLVVATP
jgi:tRNA-2-methylthio-N6-dimethylallyladenosine synthase